MWGRKKVFKADRTLSGRLRVLNDNGRKGVVIWGPKGEGFGCFVMVYDETDDDMNLEERVSFVEEALNVSHADNRFAKMNCFLSNYPQRRG